MTNAEARFNKSLCPWKPEGSLGQTAQDIHLDSHTAPELWLYFFFYMSFLYSTSLQDVRGQGKKNWEATPTASHWCHQKRSKTEESLSAACLLLPTSNPLLPSYNQPFTIAYRFETAASGGTPGLQTLLLKRVKTSSLCVSSPPVQQAAICPQAVGGQQRADCSRPHARPLPASERCAPHGRNRSLPSPPGHHHLQSKKGSCSFLLSITS